MYFVGLIQSLKIFWQLAKSLRLWFEPALLPFSERSGVDSGVALPWLFGSSLDTYGYVAAAAKSLWGWQKK